MSKDGQISDGELIVALLGILAVSAIVKGVAKAVRKTHTEEPEPLDFASTPRPQSSSAPEYQSVGGAYGSAGSCSVCGALTTFGATLCDEHW